MFDAYFKYYKVREIPNVIQKMTKDMTNREKVKQETRILIKWEL